MLLIISARRRTNYGPESKVEEEISISEDLTDADTRLGANVVG
jgi:hypothetical protein